MFAELLCVIMTTHPDAVRLLDQAFDPLGAAAAGEGDASPEARMAKAAGDVALAVGRFRPHEPPKELRTRARQAANRVRASFDPSDEVPLENACWAAAFAAVYSGIREIGEPRAVMLQTIGVIERAEAMLELEPDPRPPLVRLREIAAQTTAVLFLGYSLHSTREPGSKRSSGSKGSKRSRGGVLH